MSSIRIGPDPPCTIRRAGAAGAVLPAGFWATSGTDNATRAATAANAGNFVMIRASRGQLLRMRPSYLFPIPSSLFLIPFTFYFCLLPCLFALRPPPFVVKDVDGSEGAKASL